MHNRGITVTTIDYSVKCVALILLAFLVMWKVYQNSQWSEIGRKWVDSAVDALLDDYDTRSELLSFIGVPRSEVERIITRYGLSEVASASDSRIRGYASRTGASINLTFSYDDK